MRLGSVTLNRIAQLRRHLPFVVLAFVLGVTISGSGPALSAALPSEGAVVTNTISGSALTVSRPATTATGDVLLASVHARLTGDVSITPPNGWNLIRRDSSTTDYSSLTQALYYKVAGPSEPAGYTWSWSTTATAAGAILDFKGIDSAMPIDSHSGAFTPQSWFAVAPSVTTTAKDDIVVGFFGLASSRPLRSPSRMTEEFGVRWTGGYSSLAAKGAAYIQANAGATGSKAAWSWGRPSSGIGQLVALANGVLERSIHSAATASSASTASTASASSSATASSSAAASSSTAASSATASASSAPARAIRNTQPASRQSGASDLAGGRRRLRRRDSFQITLTR